MADTKDIRIELKQLGGLENFSLAQIREVLQISIDWFINFKKIASGTRKVRCDFPIRNFSFQEYDLSTSADIENSLVVINDKNTVPNSSQPYVFLSDLLNFVEEIRHSIASNHNILEIDDANLSELRSLGDMFSMIGITPHEQKITLKDLQKIENEQLVDIIVTRIREIRRLLAKSIKFNEETSGEAATKPTPKEIDPASSNSSDDGGGAFSPIIAGGGEVADQGGGPEPESDVQNNNQTPEKVENRPQQQPPTPFKLSELDPQAKLYLQSLSIITINQALNRYFNDTALAEIGLKPGTKITFDQLPLGIRQQLMDRAFLQVETLLLSGKFTLQDLINKPGSRVGFTSEAGLNLLIDVHGMRLMNQAVASLVKDRNQEKLEKTAQKNQQETLTKDQLSQRVKENSEVENITNSDAANSFITKIENSGELEKRISDSVIIIDSESRLDDFLWNNLNPIIGTKIDDTNKRRIIANTRSLIEVFIQEGVPPESFIDNPKNFSYTNFKRLFGNDVSDEKYEQYKEAIALLVLYYWKQKRAIWFRELRAEFGQEKYTVDEALKKSQEHLPKQEVIRKTFTSLSLSTPQNFSGGRQAIEALTDPNSAKVKGNAILSDYIQQQQDLIAKKLDEEISKKSEEELQRMFKAFFDYYKPGYVAETYTVLAFRQEILPQISPMDYYLIAGNEEMEEPVFQSNGKGLLQRAFHSQENGGDDLLNNQFTRKGLEWAIRAGVGAATSGGSEAFFKALDTMPGGEIIKEKITSEIIEKIRKNWPLIVGGLLLAWIASLLQLLLPLLLAYLAFLGIRALMQGVPLLRDLLGVETAKTLGKEAQAIFGQKAVSNEAIIGSQYIDAAKAAQATTTLTQGISSATMKIAVQAVSVTVGGVAVFGIIYQATLNSAFLTHFPYNESELAGIDEINKTSKYAEISKNARITAGCISLENNGTKCPEPSFPVSIEYTVTIKPKEDFTIQITDITDTVKFKASEKGWEEAGQLPPEIEKEVVFNFDYFKELITNQGGGTISNPLPTPVVTDGSIGQGVGQEIIVLPGESLTFTYTITDLNPNYNHTAIINTIEAKFYYENDILSGTDTMSTAARICLGECAGDTGCWPTDGNISQLPFGGSLPDKEASHRPPAAGGYADAYDIGSSGTPRKTFVTYPGELCFITCESKYGCYYVLTFDDNGETRKLLYAHFESPSSDLAPNSCKMVDAGDYIDVTGNRGNSFGIHLHYETDINGRFYGPSSRNFSILETLVPETNEGNYPPPYGDTVSTCYE